jgi:hypothetical protein
MALKLNQNQYSGLLEDLPAKLTPGSIFTSIDEGSASIYVYNEVGKPILSDGESFVPYTGATTNVDLGANDLSLTGDIDITRTEVDNDASVGISVDTSKENTDGSGFASSVYGVKSFSKANSTEVVLDVSGLWGKAEHLGSGTTYYVTGSASRGYHGGSGNSTGIYGTFSEAKVYGTGVGSHGYVMGTNIVTELNNANADVNQLQGQHVSIKLDAGTVNENIIVSILDFDNSGGTITGDFEYLRIQNDTFTSTVGGTARAIHCLSVLPSLFGGSIEAPVFKFDTAAAATVAEGELAWNAQEGTLDLGMLGGNVTQQVGQEILVHIKAAEALVDGDVVYASGAIGASGQIEVSKFLADGNTPAYLIMGIVTEPIASGSFGFITSFGKIRGLDTSAFTIGDVLYASPTVAGALTNVIPVSPAVAMPIAFVVNVHVSNGEIFSRLTPPNELAELHDVHFTEPLTSKQIIVYSTVDGHWNNETISSLFDEGANMTVLEFADNAAALVGTLVVGDIYRTGDLLKIVH